MENEIGKKLKELRVKKNLTQKELAKELSCTEIMVSRYELGISQISIPQLEKISKILEVSTGYLFGSSSADASSLKKDTFKKAFVFDLDDTLVDGRRFCGETIARVLTEVDPSIDFELVCQLHDSVKGMVIEDLYTYIMKKIGMELSNTVSMEKLLSRDFEIQQESVSRMQLFDGVVEILEFLKSNGKKIYLCTNRKKKLLTNVLQTNNIEGYFDEVISCADAGFKKPNPYCLIDLIKRSGLDTSEFIYFGDSEIDSQFAQNANIDHIIFDQYMNNKNLFKKLVNMFLERQINGDDKQ